MDIQALAIQCTADTLIRTGKGLVYGIDVCFDGVTAGDQVVLRDAVAPATGTVLWTYVAAGTDESHAFCPCIPFSCQTGIYVDVTKTGGSMYVTVVYS